MGIRKEVNINILASDVNGTILRLPVPVESLVLIGWENYCQNEERGALKGKMHFGISLTAFPFEAGIFN